MAGPIVVGTSLLDSKGGVKRTGAGSKSLGAGSSGQSLQQALSALLGGSNSASPAAIPTATANSVPGLDIAMKGLSASTGAAPATDASGYTPLQFAAALKLAQQQLGGFDASPYNDEEAAANKQAGIARGQATQNAHQAMTDDAVLYGSLKNYVAKVEHSGAKSNQKTIEATKAGYAAAHQAINDVYNKGLSAVEAVDKSRGITPNTSGLEQSKAFGNSQILSDGANAVGNARGAKASAVNNLRQTKVDVRTTGTGKVAAQREALNSELENIASALTGQLGSVEANKAAGESSYNSQLRALAASLQSQNAASDPNSIDNRLKLSEIAQHYALAAGAGSSGTGGKALKPYDAALTDIASGAPKGHAGTDTGLFNDLLRGHGPFADAHLNVNAILTDPSELGNITNAIQEQIKARAGQGYGSQDQQALLRALMAYIGKSS